MDLMKNVFFFLPLRLIFLICLSAPDGRNLPMSKSETKSPRFVIFPMTKTAGTWQVIRSSKVDLRENVRVCTFTIDRSTDEKGASTTSLACKMPVWVDRPELLECASRSPIVTMSICVVCKLPSVPIAIHAFLNCAMFQLSVNNTVLITQKKRRRWHF